MKNKVLIVTTTPYMIRQFLVNDIAILQSLGYEVEIATNNNSFGVIEQEVLAEFIQSLKRKKIKIHQVDFSRKSFAFKDHICSYKELMDIINNNNFQFVHVHTPIAGAITRFVCLRTKTRVIYTAHGFHFYHGAPLINWLLFYPIEKLCSHFTDVIITINQEDYLFAKKKMKSKSVKYVPGIGIDFQQFQETECDIISEKHKLNITKNSKILLSVGELNKNKNHQIVVRALSQIQNESLHYCIVGKGEEKENLLDLAEKLGVSSQVHLLGFRTDVQKLYSMADVFVFPSFREGLSVSLMEAMASKCACVVSRIRGNIDLIDQNGGALFSPKSVEECKAAIVSVLSSDLVSMGAHNAECVKGYDIQTVTQRLKQIYQKMRVDENDETII